MMLDLMHVTAKLLAGETLIQELCDAPACSPVPKPVEHKPHTRTLQEYVAELPEKVGPAILVHRNVVDLGKRNAGLLQAIGDGL